MREQLAQGERHMTDFAVIGGGVAGLATALLLARRGHPVTVFEGDPRAPCGDLDADFFHWPRPVTVPQALQPHLLTGAARAVLMADLPDVYGELLARGATEYREMDWYGERAHPARPGDDDLVLLQARRILVETVLYDALRAEPAATVRHGHRVTGLVTASGTGTGRGTPRVTGLRTDRGTHPAGLVVDAGGRRSAAPRWLAGAGCRPPVVERHPTGLAYFSRWYRLPEGRREGPRGPLAVSGSAFGSCAVFPADNRVFALGLILHTDDPTRTALRDPAVFEAAVRTHANGAAWLGLGAEPLSGILPMAGLDNRWSALADAQGPVVTGLLAVGDSFTHTNPTMAQGMPLSLWSARWLARHVDAHGDPAGAGLAAAHHAWALRTLRPWFDVQVETDDAIGRRYAERSARPPSDRDRQRAAMTECGLEDPVVGRARARVRHLLVHPRDAYGDPEVQRHLADWLAARPDWEPARTGPDREEWEKVTSPV
jgi:2-polyprenyl-6-methoxyphenol hydroxylase-like FAD-dependent oxidoreductase